jgi:hypothetical protein
MKVHFELLQDNEVNMRTLLKYLSEKLHPAMFPGKAESMGCIYSIIIRVL